MSLLTFALTLGCATGGPSRSDETNTKASPPTKVIAQDPKAVRRQWRDAQKHLANIELPRADMVRWFDCPETTAPSDHCRSLHTARKRYTHEHDFVGAVEHAVAALQKEPNSFPAIQLIGLSLVQLGRHCEEALPFLELTTELRSQGTVAVYLHCAFESGDATSPYSHAMRLAEMAARFYADPWFHFAAAKLHIRGGRIAAARDHAAELAAYQPTGPRVWRLYSGLMLELDEHDAALEAARLAVKLRRDLSAEEGQREEDLELHHLTLIEALIATGGLEEALQQATALSKSPDSETRERAERLIVRITAAADGATAAYQKLLDLSVEDPNTHAETVLLHLIAEHRAASFPPEETANLYARDRMKLLILQQKPAQAASYAAACSQDPTGFLSLLDFRSNDCEALAAFPQAWGRSHHDAPDTWKGAIVDAAWSRLCDHRAPSEAMDRSAGLSQRERAVREASVSFVRKHFQRATLALADLPPLDEPVYHEFRALLAAGTGDEAEFRKWEELASRGPASTESLPLARMLFHLRHGEAAKARAAWVAAAPVWREQPLLFPLHTTYIGYMVVEAAHEVDPALARDLAHVWFPAQGGVLESRVRQMLEHNAKPREAEKQARR